MLGLTPEALAAESKLSLAMVKMLETDVGSADAKSLVTLRTALEARGVLFLANGSDGTGGAGIRFKQRAENGGTRPENLNATNDD